MSHSVVLSFPEPRKQDQPDHSTGLQCSFPWAGIGASKQLNQSRTHVGSFYSPQELGHSGEGAPYFSESLGTIFQLCQNQERFPDTFIFEQFIQLTAIFRWALCL